MRVCGNRREKFCLLAGFELWVFWVFVCAQVEREMEALKTSFRMEMAARPFVSDEIVWPAAHNTQNASSSDDFLVDDLLDFSNDEGLAQAQEQEGEERNPKEEGGGGGGGGGEGEGAKLVSSASYSAEERFSAEKDELGPLPASELSVPDDDLADLEWLSHFVDDSFTKFSSPFPAGFPAEKPRNPQNHQNRSGPEALGLGTPHFATPSQAKSRRSKRARTGGRVWSLGSPSLTDASSSSCSSSSTSSNSPASNWLVCTTHPVQRFEPLENVTYLESKLPAKKQKRPAQQASGPTQPTRRCSHCGVQKTPQWRAGPLGAKTLCNACGVRFKSGRLFPEYRPACSPTFSSEMHSNHHRKVLEMRRKKEVLGPTGSAQAVPSF
ncbi:GATA transcription factor 5-like [Rhodamnia argentea]|uniref:GATA transcription factor n=1 Tax=Rhodamnia argentea TaxID=178133 RepID=A0A8B8NP90_9MYRT|nr:GATA transcription factor 5-like [Rhodamnia argentea]